jgi:DNA (cytosine-5)-methyltransferase 1
VTSRPILSLFSGCGGLDLGMEQAGFGVPLALDRDKSAVASYNGNRQGAPARVMDLVGTSADLIEQEWVRVSADGPVGVVGGPPCQAFSVGNYRQDLADPRRHLPIRYASLLKEFVGRFDIRFFVFENVIGLLGTRHANYFQMLLAMLREAGFPQIDTIVLDALDFGVAQSRRRVFLIGRRGGGTKSALDLDRLSRPERKTVRDAIGHLPEPKYFERGSGPPVDVHPNHWSMRPRSPRLTTSQSVAGETRGRSFRRLRWDAPSWTVSYGHREVHVHPDGHRRLSVLESLLLQGFPESYVLTGTMSDQFRLVSDAVPPPLGRAVGLGVASWLDLQSARAGHVPHRGALGVHINAPRSTSA